MNTTLEEIQEWYESQCDGDWEHAFGVNLKTLENTGWKVKIAIAETEWEDKPFSELIIKRTDDDWVHCMVEYGYFEGFGGPGNLKEIFDVFLEWISSTMASKDISTSLDRFQEWYRAQKDEHYEITLDTLDNPGWNLGVRLSGTKLKDKPFERIWVDREDEDDWIRCSIKNGSFAGYGGPKNLDEILTAFLSWVES
ncbi:MAG: Imm53 family immunity protein [Parachlamydiaceae bacterium]